MLNITIPGYANLRIKSLLLDYNGTLALDGSLLSGVNERLVRLSDSVQIHILTADTFGGVRSQLDGIRCELLVIPPGDEKAGKLEVAQQLGLDTIVSIGNGRNDELMVKQAALGIVVSQGEGVAVETLIAADVVCPNILAALDLLIHPLRLTATLRS